MGVDTVEVWVFESPRAYHFFSISSGSPFFKPWVQKGTNRYKNGAGLLLVGEETARISKKS
jgi:hypothetical protein